MSPADDIANPYRARQGARESERVRVEVPAISTRTILFLALVSGAVQAIIVGCAIAWAVMHGEPFAGGEYLSEFVDLAWKVSLGFATILMPGHFVLAYMAERSGMLGERQSLRDTLPPPA